DADLRQDAVLVDAATIVAAALMGGPFDPLGRNLPMLAIMAESRLGPRLDDDLPMLFVELLLQILIGRGVAVPVGEPLIMLADGVEPARLVAAREAREGPPLRHLV